VDGQTDSKEPHCLYPAQDMHGRWQFPGHFVGLEGTMQFASQERNKEKVQNIFVISPHDTSPHIIALFTILLYHLSCYHPVLFVKLGGGGGGGEGGEN